MSSLNSAAVFEEALKELGLERLWPRFQELKWTTHRTFAMAAPPSAHGPAEEAVFLRCIAKRVLDIPESATDETMPPDVSLVRLLYFESHTMAIADLRNRTTKSSEPGSTKRLPDVELESRKAKLQARIGIGFPIEGEVEPADCLIDRFTKMVEEGRITHVPWNKCASKTAELQVATATKTYLPDVQGKVTEVSLWDEPDAPIEQFWDVNRALQRRAVALDMAGLMSWEVHEQLRETYMRAMTEKPSDKRWQAPPMSMIQDADLWVWRQIQGRVSGKDIRATTPKDGPPADKVLKEIMNSVPFHMKLAPVAALPGQQKRGRSRSPPKGAAKKKARGGGQQGPLALTAGPQSELEELRAENARLRAAASRAPPPGNFGAASSSGGGGKGQRGARGNRGGRSHEDDDQRKGQFMPEALRGGINRLPDGRQICFGFNLGDCSRAAPGGTCPRGVHVCTKIGCGGAHPVTQCTKR